MLRYNSQGGTPVDLEYYDGAAWTELARGGAVGGTVWATANVRWAGVNVMVVLSSYNFSSFTNVSGTITCNFLNPPPNANYVVVASALDTGGGQASGYISANRTTSSFLIGGQEVRITASADTASLAVILT
jgi:hypothetical protein